MRILVDANILLRIAQFTSASHAAAMSALIKLGADGHELCLVPQCIYEYWVVATRPVTVNGLGLSVNDVDQQVRDLLSRFTLLRDERGIFSHWYDLVVQNSVQGKLAHDTRLVAAMQRHNLQHLLTWNTSDFARFSGVQAISPDQVLAGQLP